MIKCKWKEVRLQDADKNKTQAHTPEDKPQRRRKRDRSLRWKPVNVQRLSHAFHRLFATTISIWENDIWKGQTQEKRTSAVREKTCFNKSQHILHMISVTAVTPTDQMNTTGIIQILMSSERFVWVSRETTYSLYNYYVCVFVSICVIFQSNHHNVLWQVHFFSESVEKYNVFC